MKFRSVLRSTPFDARAVPALERSVAAAALGSMGGKVRAASVRAAQDRPQGGSQALGLAVLIFSTYNVGGEN